MRGLYPDFVRRSLPTRTVLDHDALQPERYRDVVGADAARQREHAQRRAARLDEPVRLELYYQADRGSGMDFYMVRRSSPDDPFGPEQPIPELNDPAYDQDLRLSPDRRHAVFSSQRSGAGDLYEASR
jgi:hypothetical protein